MNEKLQQLLGGSHSAKQEEATPPTYPSEEALLGVWTYQAPSIEYKGDDMFASIAVAGLQDQLATHYVKAGLVPGQGTVSFKKRNRLHASMGGHEIDGTYSYDPATGTAAITLIQDGKQATFQGYLSLRGEVLTLSSMQAMRSKPCGTPLRNTLRTRKCSKSPPSCKIIPASCWADS